ncbi:MAG: N-6 DNA methylase [bacterium]|nr:N-6 DNA methylase [bacterium]
MFKKYLISLTEIANRGDAREESFYSALEILLHDFAEKNGKPKCQITTLPSKTEAGNPDFRIWDGNVHITGYIEAKAPTVTDLDAVERTEQLKRYRETFPNLILTNFCEFRLYRNGTLTNQVKVARPIVLTKLNTTPPLEKAEIFNELLEKFFSFSLPNIFTAEQLAFELAKRTRFLRDEVITLELDPDEEFRKDSILGFYHAFKDYLTAGLSKEDFADVYAQTITYGLFAARTRTQKGFNRKLAYDLIPPSIGILRDVFKFISLGEPSKNMEWIIDDISEVLEVTDVEQTLQYQYKFFKDSKGRDPIVHFYEPFLAKYDPTTRERRGVFYTPESVVSYIVRSLDLVLKKQFKLANGIAEKTVTVLDPAAGTGTFLAETARLAVDNFISKYGEGAKANFIRDHILTNFFGFELMMAPYTVGHLKLTLVLAELGYQLQDTDRFKLYLTNTLEHEDLGQTTIPGIASLSEESHAAGEVKRKQPILLILGNPPYSGHSANFNDWINLEIKKYFKVDGKDLGEKNPKWLQDDYVKFIRFAQWKIDKMGEGVLGFITNHSYLDNPTFRGMRQSLMNSFNEIYLLDLHGNSLKKEKCPDGSKDTNVFDIRQGVAIGIFVKQKGKKSGCKVFHADLYGLREDKYNWLWDHEIQNTKWRELTPKSPSYLFIPRDERLLSQYEKYPKITDIFPVNSVGIVTARDDLTIKWTPDEVWKTVQAFTRLEPEMARRAYDLGKDTRDWKVEFAQEDLKTSGLDQKRIVPILYRPFDVHYTYYTGRSRGFHCMPRSEVMQHMLQKNLCLCVGRAGQVVGQEKPWNVAFVSNSIVDFNVFYRGGEILLPLLMYNNPPKNITHGTAMVLHEPKLGYEVRKYNLNAKLLKNYSKEQKTTITGESFFSYIYAILFSNTYRKKYAEFLKGDFPRIPFTANTDLFAKLSRLGQRLIDLHLLHSDELDLPLAKYEGKGEDKIEYVKYSDKKVYIHDFKYFEGIKPEVWDYHVGGYQVCRKWLKDRKGRTLTMDEIMTYCRIVTALAKTIEVQKEIDRLYPGVEAATIDFSTE